MLPVGRNINTVRSLLLPDCYYSASLFHPLWDAYRKIPTALKNRLGGVRGFAEERLEQDIKQEQSREREKCGTSEGGRREK